MLAMINKRNSDYSAREWTIRFGTLIIQLRKKPGERKPERPHWRQFDETHHWDSIAEEWVPNDDK